MLDGDYSLLRSLFKHVSVVRISMDCYTFHNSYRSRTTNQVHQVLPIGTPCYVLRFYKLIMQFCGVICRIVFVSIVNYFMISFMIREGNVLIYHTYADVCQACVSNARAADAVITHTSSLYARVHTYPHKHIPPPHMYTEAYELCSLPIPTPDDGTRGLRNLRCGCGW